MVSKWDSQQALKPPAFDQDDYVTSVGGHFDVAVTSRGGRLNMGWKKASSRIWTQICCTLHAYEPALLPNGYHIAAPAYGTCCHMSLVACSVCYGVMCALHHVDGPAEHGKHLLHLSAKLVTTQQLSIVCCHNIQPRFLQHLMSGRGLLLAKVAVLLL